MNIRLKKSWRDLSAQPARSLMVLVGLIVGLWGMGTVFISYVVLQNDLNRNFLATDPAHLVLESSDFQGTLLTQLIADPRVAAAEFRALTKARIEVAADQWIPLWLYGVNDFSDTQLAHLKYQSGRDVPSAGSLLIERNGLLISDLAVNRNASVRIAGEVKSVPISGITFDAAQPPSTQESFIYGYTDLQSFGQLTGLNPQQRLILRFSGEQNAQSVKQLSQQLITELSEQGISAHALRLPDFEQHPHQWQLNTILFVVLAVGALTFVLSAVLVNQLIKATLAQQIRQIGVMKALGARRNQILTLYVQTLLILGAAASAVAIPLAVLSGEAYATFVSTVLNFDVLTTDLPWWSYAFLLAAGLLMPLVFSANTLLRGTRITIVEALRDYGISANAASSKPATFLWSRLPLTLQLAGRNIQRNRKRFLVTMASMALGVAIFNTGFNVRSSLQDLLNSVDSSIGYDVQVIFAEPITVPEAQTLFAKLDNVSETEYWSGGLGLLQSEALATADGMGLVALPADSNYLNLPIIDGHWLSGEPAQMVMNQSAWRASGSPAIGEQHTIQVGELERAFVLTGVVQQLDLAKIYVDIADYQQWTGATGFNTLSFRAFDDNYAEVIALKRAIEQRLEGSSRHVIAVVSDAERVQVIYDHLNIILSTLISLSILVLLVAAIGLASTTSVNILERTREIGVLRAIGATPKTVYQIFVWEGGLISLISIVLGLLVAQPASIHASEFFGLLMLGEASALTYSFSTVGLMLTVLFTLLFSWLASRIPARKAMTVPTTQALAYE